MNYLADFCKTCHGLTEQQILARFNTKIREFEGRAKTNKKKGRFAIDNFSNNYEFYAKKLTIMAEQIAGDPLSGHLNDEQTLVNEIKEKMK